MPTTYPEQTNRVTLFSRERRRQRMLQFLEAFERRSRRTAPDLNFSLPSPREESRESNLAALFRR